MDIIRSTSPHKSTQRQPHRVADVARDADFDIVFDAEKQVVPSTTSRQDAAVHMREAYEEKLRASAQAQEVARLEKVERAHKIAQMHEQKQKALEQKRLAERRHVQELRAERATRERAREDQKKRIAAHYESLRMQHDEERKRQALIAHKQEERRKQEEQFEREQERLRREAAEMVQRTREEARVRAQRDRRQESAQEWALMHTSVPEDHSILSEPAPEPEVSPLERLDVAPEHTTTLGTQEYDTSEDVSALDPVSISSAPRFPLLESIVERTRSFLGPRKMDDATVLRDDTDDTVASADDFSLRDLFARDRRRRDMTVRSVSYRFAVIALLGTVGLGSTLFVGHALATKDRVEKNAHSALASLKAAAASAQSGNLTRAYKDIDSASDFFTAAHEDMESINGFIVSLSRYVPVASQLASGDALVAASVELSAGLREMTALTQEIDILQKAARADGPENFSLLAISERFFTHTKTLLTHLDAATELLETVHPDDVPDAQRAEFITLTRLLDPLVGVLREATDLEVAVTELLGGSGPRTYLFLFQNNQEMRGSGGFIGSYGFLDMRDGHIREFKIDGIYNPDGQLTDKVVPPRPIQKISAAWSMHDSNWWPDFPTSAEKAMDFYARTGGPSVDGVVAVTPVMVERLLELTGPITLPEYDVTLTSENFIELTQYKVEIDYDKQENRPKKILSDLMPALMGELSNDLSRDKAAQLLQIVMGGLDERHIMIYMRNDEVREIIEEQHWGGRILETEDDYLSVVHANINGFKTDGVIDEEIEHVSELTSDGRIVNTVTITRHHRGGDTGREWWDAVNADYLRVYVPEGSRLLSAVGHTREWHEPRLDYEALGFEVDPRVAQEESSAYTDPDSGTRIYTDAGKTVFGNWVYVSPQETVRVTYQYELPWRFVTESDRVGRFGAHAILFQKQAGAENVEVTSEIRVADGMEIISRVPQGSSVGEHSATSSRYGQNFDADMYRGVIFRME